MAVNDRDGISVPRSLLLATVTLLSVVSGMATIARTAASLGSDVGDAVVFDPTRTADFTSESRLSVTRTQTPQCVLDVGLLQRSGGSLMVEQTDAGPQRLYHVHWAGGRTADGTDDCGADADLMLTQLDLNTLAAAAGGFGVTHRPFLR